jgi:hypothetical protein
MSTRVRPRSGGDGAECGRVPPVVVEVRRGRGGVEGADGVGVCVSGAEGGKVGAQVLILRGIAAERGCGDEAECECGDGGAGAAVRRGRLVRDHGKTSRMQVELRLVLQPNDIL